MKRKTTQRRALLHSAVLGIAVAMASLWVAPAAIAQSHVQFGISIGSAPCWGCRYAPPPRYYYPPAYRAAPVYYYPGPVYYVPRPVYRGYGYRYRPYRHHRGYYRGDRHHRDHGRRHRHGHYYRGHD